MTDILETRRPNLAAKSTENYNCVHVAAMVADPRPLQLLLRYHWVQECIDDELVLSGQTARQGCKNTALTVAVSFGNVAQVFLLLSEFPRAVDAEPDSPQPATANVDQASANGSPPLYMAVFKKNAKLVQVLLAANADSTAVGAKNDSCIDLAHRLKNEQDAAIEKRQERALQENKPFVKPPESDIDRIVKLLDGTPNLDFEELKRKFCPELVPKVELPPDEADDDQENEAAAKPEAESAAQKPQTAAIGGKGVEKLLNGILKAVEGINGRLETLERVVAGWRPIPHDGPTGCFTCAGPNGQKCTTCQRSYCEACGAKPTHTCH
jgi:hypothetical protein